MVRIEFDALAVGFDRLVEVALLEERVAPHGVGDGHILGRCLAVGNQALAGVLARLGFAIPRAANSDVVSGRRVGEDRNRKAAQGKERKTKGAPHLRIAPDNEDLSVHDHAGSFKPVSAIPPIAGLTSWPGATYSRSRVRVAVTIGHGGRISGYSQGQKRL